MSAEPVVLSRNRLGDLCARCQRLVLPLAGFRWRGGVWCRDCKRDRRVVRRDRRRLKAGPRS